MTLAEELHCRSREATTKFVTFMFIGEKEAEPTQVRSKVLQKKKPRVVISDDEGDDDDEGDAKDVLDSDAEVSEDDAEDAGREVHYDSEENEIEVEPEQNFKGFVGKKGRSVET